MDYGQHAEQQDRQSVGRSIVNVLLMVAGVVALSWALRTFVFQPYEIPSGSMESTIMTGDMIFSEKITYDIRDIEPGDIVTFADPQLPERTLIKRVIATGGSTVNLVGDHVYVDGVQLDEPYTSNKPSRPFDSSEVAYGVTIEYPYTVPEGYLWVMGDNRTNSLDSRYFGAVDASTVNGHANFIYWPISRVGTLS